MCKTLPTVLLVPPSALPIPAVGGGAIETLITNLLDENEKYGFVHFIVISKYDAEAAKCHYKYSEILYFSDGVLYGKKRSDGLLGWFITWCIRKVFHNRISRKLFGMGKQIHSRFCYCCYKELKKRKIDFVSFEGVNEFDWLWLKEFVPTSRIYTHNHYSRDESLSVRMIVPNSISISNYVRSCWCKTQLNHGNNVVLLNGIKTESFVCCDVSVREKQRRAYGFKNDEIVVLYCGRIIPEKGVLELVEAYKMIASPSIKLFVIGSVDFSTNSKTEYSNKVIKLIDEIEGAYYQGYVPNEQTPAFYAMADVQVVPTICQEGAGLVAIEGMASGLPLIVTESGGMPEYVGNVAVKVPINDNLSSNLAKEIDHLAHSPELRKQMVIAGKERAAQFSSEAYYHNFVEIVNGLEMKSE